jgi:enamine deaminase RidA (YjgF/YER057c/UK114 family)
MIEDQRSIIRSDVDEDYACSGVVEAGDFVFISYCLGNVGQPIENQIIGAIDLLEKRLETKGLTLESVVNVKCLFKDIMDLPALKKVFKERFNGKYPSRMAVQSDFVIDGLLFQIDAVAFKG